MLVEPLDGFCLNQLVVLAVNVGIRIMLDELFNSDY